MMAITLHAIDDDLSLALQRRAAETGESLNRTIKDLLAVALGLSASEARPDPDFMRFAGKLSRKDADEMRSFLKEANFSKVDAEAWK